MTDRAQFSPLMNEIADVVGDEATIALIAARGGTRVHIPARVDDRHWLVDVMGRDAADKLCRHFRVGAGGSYIELPVGTKKIYARAREKAFALRGTKSVEAIALALGVHRRTVTKWFADRPDDRQGSLF